MDVYEQTAMEFLQETNATIQTEFVGMDYNELWGDNQCRPKYRVAIETPRGKMSIVYWDSALHREWLRADEESVAKELFKCHFEYLTPGDKAKVRATLHKRQKEAVPTTYDILCCLETTDPGSFSEFCDEFGYDTDSRRALSIYLLCQEQYHDLLRIFSSKDLDKLSEINNM